MGATKAASRSSLWIAATWLAPLVLPLTKQMKIHVVVVVIALFSARSSFAAIGFQEATVPDPGSKSIAIGIWYPSSAQSSPQPLGMFTQSVAVNGVVAGKGLPLVLISHGTGGSLASHYDTAIALAQAGFVAAAITHTGDNYSDQRYVGNRQDLIDRPRQIKIVLDWILSSWIGHNHLDASRVGIFGFSLGGFTSLVIVGGTPELSRMAQLCSASPSAPECTFIKQAHGDQLEPSPVEAIWVHDARINAAVVAAPAVGFLFGPGDLRGVKVPIQLWRAENDTQAPDAWNSALVREGLTRHAEEHVVPGVDHFVFLAPCSEALARAAPQICRDVRGFDRAAFHREFNQAVVSFYGRELQRNAPSP
jgi:predicted dienelactone hydrolase